MRFGHVAIRVRNIEEMLDFYFKLGLQEAFRINNHDGSLRIVYLHISEKQYLELCLGGDEKPLFDDTKDVGVRHICFTVENLSKSKKEMEKRGIIFDSEILTLVDNNLAAYLFDPDGNKIEIMEVREESPHKLFEMNFFQEK